jgi:hypothetical protein
VWKNRYVVTTEVTVFVKAYNEEHAYNRKIITLWGYWPMRVIRSWRWAGVVTSQNTKITKWRGES